MINAELSYNPYLMETKIRFNGQPPRINSLVEKYQNMSLQSWISRIPKIFYDEMNGYYFELDFSGTSSTMRFFVIRSGEPGLRMRLFRLSINSV